MIIPSFFRHSKPLLQNKIVTRPIFHWLNIIFNQVDHIRIQSLGPDRVCSEWLLRNGAAVQWVGAQEYLRDYNSLPLEGYKFYVEKIDATGSSISHYGFLHLRGCNYIREIILHDCGYIENEALRLLHFVKGTLEHLQVSKCGNITESGLMYLKELSKLKSLDIHNLPYVKNKEEVIKNLRKLLPNCNITSDFEVKEKASSTQ